MSEEVIKEVTASVFKYILPDTWSEEKKEANPIAAERVVEAIKYGKDVEIKNALIKGPFILKSVNAEGEIIIQNTKISGDIDWSYATFKRVLNLKDSIFETFETDATFIAVTVEKDLILDGATFWGEANFSNVTVMGAFYSRSTTFAKDAIFTDGTFKKRIEFSKSTFVGVANFENARIGGTAKFTGVKFKKKASFNGAQIEESALFYPADLFSIDVEFEDDLNNGIISKKLKDIFKTKDYSLSENAMVTNGQDDKWRITDMYYLFSWENLPRGDINRLLRFLVDDLVIRWATDARILIFDFYKTICIFKDENSVEIKIDVKKEKATLKISDGRTHDLKVKEENGKLNIYPDIEKIYIVKKEEGKLNISNPATFVGEAGFISARIGSNAKFMEAKFKEKASFNRAQIKESAFFNPATFKGEADFVSARIGSNARFTGVKFEKKAIFNSAQIEGSAFFNPATFKGDANFVSARIGSTAEFTGVKFEKKATFNSAMINGVACFKSSTFEGKVDFISARIDSNAEFPVVKFKSDADFVSARIGGVAEFTGAEFKQQASFNRAQIEESAFFKLATFVGEADFVSARIGGVAGFTGAEFKQLTTFNSAQIVGAAFFNPAYLFSIDVEFKDDLNNGIISEKMRNILKTEDYSLSETAMVTKEKDDNRTFSVV